MTEIFFNNKLLNVAIKQPPFYNVSVPQILEHIKSMLFDLLRICGITVLAAIFVFFIQPFLFYSGIIVLTDVDPVDWVNQQYMRGAAIVFTVSLLATLLWYMVAARSKAVTASAISSMRLVWALLLFLPLIAIGAALIFFNNSSEALLWITAMYIGDVLLLYWFNTAISSPKLLKYVPPGSMLVRSIIPGL
ncbi:hypothetical protein L5220_06470 [Synechococcus sp. PCC 6716]|nr:hypothetical protein [Synechococcus sp. PCC 6716]